MRLNEPQYLSWGGDGGLNQVDPRYLSLGDALLDDINDHPEIPKPYPSFEGSVGQALRPFPQYYGISSHRLNGGFSNYHALQAAVTKRSSYGLSFLAAYTFGKALGTADTAGPGNYYDYGQDWYNRKSDYSVTQYKHTAGLEALLDLQSAVWLAGPLVQERTDEPHSGRVDGERDPEIYVGYASEDLHLDLRLRHHLQSRVPS
jgi:hypothetical protein